jgi:pyruvate,orthophosphate dikinase
MMIPLVAWATELEAARHLGSQTAAAAGLRETVDFSVGTMIELPRACLQSSAIAGEASFLSYGTNDLTQTSLGLSRDDTESTVVRHYQDLGILTASPFQTVDIDGVGELIGISSRRARTANPNIQLGVCGEHGGDPESIQFFDSLRLDYVSCSPFRLPTARVAAAQSEIKRARRAGNSFG